MGTLNRGVGKVTYGLLFMLVLPAALYLWARNTQFVIQLPVPDVPAAGVLLLITGSIICLWGMLNLIWYGKGLPMNAYPPRFYVHNGIYAAFKHPIYSGSGMIAFGLSLYFKSSSGFWLVSPIFCLAMVAFVAGFENEKIKSTNGYFDQKPLFSLPGESVKAPSAADRLNIFVLALIPWAILYELFIFIGVPKDAIYTNLPFEQKIPVIKWPEAFYELPYIMVLIIPFILTNQLQVRSFVRDVWWAMFFVFLMYLAFPFAVHQRNFEQSGFLGGLIYLERSYDGTVAALPSFHVVWAFLIAKYFPLRFGFKWFWQILAVVISLSCIANGSHSILDVITGYIIYLLVNNRYTVWRKIKLATEKLANSWHEWRWGPVRLINHGIYAGAAILLGMLIVEGCLSESSAPAGFFVAIAGIVGAALWAQIVEGSPRLLRPYGYYGSVIGGILAGAIVAPLYHITFLYLLAAFSLAAPWFQIIGRLRCLVQGCCHGKPCNVAIGIRFTNPQSRVLKIASLKGVPIHPTQLYSIGSNLLIALILARFCSLQVPVSLIAGIYFILNGLSRFVEEALRGEPQTAYLKGLRLYQWLAMVAIVSGAFITCIPAKEHLAAAFYPEAFISSLILGVIATAAYGLDFPESNRRFARLTS